MDLFKLTPDLLKTLLFLAPGYLGFRLYRIDQSWNDLNPIHIIYGSLIFSALGYATYYGLIALGVPDNPFWFVIAIGFFAVLYAFFWRVVGHKALHRLLQKMGVTNEDNSGTPWSLIFNNPKVFLSQITVHLKDGSAVKSEDTKEYNFRELTRLGIHPYYADTAGDLYLVCTHYRPPETTEWEEVPEIHCTPPWGIKLSFIPHGEITRIEARATQSG